MRLCPSLLVWVVLIKGGLGFSALKGNFTEHVISRDYYPEAVVSVDLDGDGLPDVLSTSEDGRGRGQLVWYQNWNDTDGYWHSATGPTGEQPFIPPRVISTETKGVSSVFSIDLDGDNRPDVLAAENYCHHHEPGCVRNRGSLAWYKNLRGAGPDLKFGKRQLLATTSAEYGAASQILSTDLYGDGRNDVLAIIVDGAHGMKIAVFQNLGGGKFGRQQNITSFYFQESIFSIDLDGDGRNDLLSAGTQKHTKMFGNHAKGFVGWHRNLGHGKFGPLQIITDKQPAVTSIFSIDLDGDSLPDVLATGGCFDGGGDPPGTTVSWYRNLGSGKFGQQEVINNNSLSAPVVISADLDGDLRPDVVVSANGAVNGMAGVVWHQNLGGGKFGPAMTIFRAHGHFLQDDQPYLALASIDYHVDGRADLIVAARSAIDKESRKQDQFETYGLRWYQNHMHRQHSTAALLV